MGRLFVFLYFVYLVYFVVPLFFFPSTWLATIEGAGGTLWVVCLCFFISCFWCISWSLSSSFLSSISWSFYLPTYTSGQMR